MVKYDKDYARDSLVKNTGWFSVKDFLGDGELGYRDNEGNLGYRTSYFNLEESDTELVFEANYIRSQSTAFKLQEFLAMWYCNQHTIMNVDVDLKYLNLQVGDIIKFDKIIEDVKAYGEDYTIENVRNSQIIYPLFMITSVTKTPNKVSITCIQLHDLTRKFTADIGDINRDGNISESDIYDLISYLSQQEEAYTREQISNMDFNGDNRITWNDLFYMLNNVENEIEGYDG